MSRLNQKFNVRKSSLSGLMLMGMVLVFLGSVSCTKEEEVDLNVPQNVLKAYISDRFEVNSLGDKEKLLKYTGGKVYEKIRTMTDEDFEKVFVNSPLKFNELSILNKRLTGKDRAQVTYELSMEDHSKDEETQKPLNAKVTNKKMVILHREKGEWLIVEARNIKTAVEFTDHQMVFHKDTP